MDFSEIVEHLKDLNLDSHNMGLFAEAGKCIHYDGYYEYEFDVMGILEENFGVVEIVDRNPNHMGYGGVNFYCVYAFRDHDVYIKYVETSGYGNQDWDKPREVRPFEKTIIEYKFK